MNRDPVLRPRCREFHGQCFDLNACMLGSKPCRTINLVSLTNDTSRVWTLWRLSSSPSEICSLNVRISLLSTTEQSGTSKANEDQANLVISLCEGLNRVWRMKSGATPLVIFFVFLLLRICGQREWGMKAGVLCLRDLGCRTLESLPLTRPKRGGFVSEGICVDLYSRS